MLDPYQPGDCMGGIYITNFTNQPLCTSFLFFFFYLTAVSPWKSKTTLSRNFSINLLPLLKQVCKPQF